VARLNIYCNLENNVVKKGIPNSLRFAYRKGHFLPSSSRSLLKKTGSRPRKPSQRYSMAQKERARFKASPTTGGFNGPKRPSEAPAPLPLLKEVKELSKLSMTSTGSIKSPSIKQRDDIPSPLKNPGKPLQLQDIFPEPNISDVSLSSSASEPSDDEGQSQKPPLSAGPSIQVLADKSVIATVTELSHLYHYHAFFKLKVFFCFGFAL
jgi:hypothetical protein